MRNWTAMQRISFVVVCAWLLAVAGEAAAYAEDGEARGRAHYQLGRAAFAQGHYDRAIKEFETGYRNKPMPGFLYNIAQAAELAGQSQKALDHYRLYLQMRPAAPERDEVTRHIASLERALAPRPSDERALVAAPNAIVAGPAMVVQSQPKPDHHKLIIGLSVAGAVLVLGAAAVGAVVGEQMQAEYHPWGMLGITPH
jgi:tetratricopeptide (TPR) repeat protein